MTSFIFALLIIIFIVHIMGCVNVSSKDFIRLARNSHVSKEALEVITHKYWIERGSEELFPTNVYIQAQLGNTEYIEKSKNVKELWQSDYSIPKTFGTFEEVKRAAEYAAKFFPKEAIEYYKDNKGDYVLSIRKPVSKLNRGAKGMLIITDAEGNRLPMLSQQEVEDYALITEQLLPKSEKNSKFAAEIKKAVESQDHISAFIENAIKSGKWNEYTVKVFNNLIKKIKDGQIDFKRTVGERFSFTEAISDIHAAASLITRGAYGAERKGQKNSKEQYERDAAQGKQQEKLIEAWAKASDLWLNDYEDAEGNRARTLEELLNSQWDYFDQGSESEVYRYDDTQFLKSISLSHTNDNIAKALDKIALFNHMFPETALNIVGFGRDSLGHFRIIALQNIIKGEELTNEELQEFNNKYKLKESKSTGWFESQDGVALLTDLSPMNIKKDAEGNYFVIDADVAFNTPEMGGNVMFQNSLEYSDTPLQFSINRRNTGPQTFTFNDGTTVSVPFKPNVQQEDALNVINDFIHSDETSMTLSGYAGTGKTSLMEIIANKMRREYRNIIFSATTNKAAAVLKERVSKAGFDAKTLNKVFGINVEVDSSKAYNARNLVTKVNEADIPYGTVVVIDEASMINEANYDILNEIARKNGLKIIYVGDKAQLAPVNEKQISKVFRNTEGHIVELTQVERTDDNAILKEATNLRNGMSLSGESSFNSKGEGVAFMSAKSREDISKVINHYIQGLRSNPNFFRILAYTNKAITSYNDFVRKGLGYDDYVPRVGEPITGYANWGYDRAIKNYRFINSEAYTVTKVRKPQEVRITIDGQTHKMTAVPITIEDAMGNTDEVKFMDIRGNANNLRVARLLAEKKAELWNRWRRSGSPEARVELQRQINAIEEFLFVNDFIEDTTKTDKDGKHPILQKKVVDYGYAITIHKSQGSTFTHVLIDDIDIANHINKDNNPENAFVNVDLGEEGNRVTADTQQIGEEDVDLGDLGEIDTTPQINDEAVNIRQQLEYVGVSRATDTVTILSDNVKKEDSPLNHSLDSTEQKEDTGLPQSMQKPTEQISSAEIWEYMSSLMPLTKRSQVEYTPQNQEKQIYSVEGGHIYNKEGKEVYPEGTIHRTHRNKILANNAVKEGLAVVVTHPDSKEKYVVDNNKQIISVRTGEIMKWGEGHGDRRKIIAQATQAFRDRINAIKERGSAYTEQLLDYLELIGLDVHNETEMAQYLKEHESKTIQQAITEQQEMDGIKAKAIADGTFMKAPNGKPTNLTERQWLQVRTKNFINWFGDWINNPANASKVVDKNGEPLVVYHYTNDSFNIFDSSKSEDGVFYFTDNKRPDNIYYPNREVRKNSMPVFLNMRRLGYSFGGLLFREKEDALEAKRAHAEMSKTWSNEDIKTWNTAADKRMRKIDIDRVLSEEAKLLIEMQGFQGFEEFEDTGDTFYAVFNPNQAKSATDNNGMFSTENDDIQAMQTPEGEIRGFATPEGSLYFDRNVISPEHPIHEYTHLWDRVVAKNNPELWQRGVSLMKQISLWKTIEKDANYGEKWKALKNMTEQKLESLIASEVHSRLTGRNSEQILDRLSREKGQKGIVGRLKQWLLDFWKELKSTFSDWSKEDLDKLTLQEFTMMTVRDFADGFNPNAFKQEPQQTKLLVTETSSDMSMNSSEASTTALEDTLNKTRDYYRWQRDHITFDEKTHTYYYDGRRVDYSVTEYKDEIYGKPNIQGDYSHSSAMGRSVDALTRDFFTKGKDPRNITYPNINNARKQQILKDLERLKKHFDEEFNGVYRVITPEFKLAARINTPNGERTIAGTMDMLIIDGDGNLHILDMKVKNHPITQTYRGKEVNDRRDYTFQLNAYRQILEALYPEFTGKVKDLKLIWFDTKYPKQGKEAVFSTDEAGVVTVSDSKVKNAPLSEYAKWETPSLKENIDNSLIPLTQNNVLENVKAINENWRSERQPAMQPSSTRLPYTGIISITQNASGRLGTMDASDEAAFKDAKEVLRDSKASEEEIKDAVNTIDEIYDRKNAEMQSILEEVSKIADVSFTIEDAAGSWLGGEEYSFKVKIEAKTQEDYDKAIQALSYVAEATKQDAFIENLGEVNEREVTAESLLNKEHTPFIHIPFTKKLSQQEIAVVQNIFSSNSTEEVPLDATVTEDEIIFSMPTWKLKDNPTEEEYKDFYTKWLNKIIETYNNGKERELKGLVREVHRRTYEKSRFHEAGNAYSEQSERNYSSFRDSYLSERGLSKESKGTLSEEEGQRIKETVEKLFKESSAPQEVNLPGYNYFNDLNENTKVDAAWKIPLLQELDGQLSNENTAEENTDILSQMDSILQAESQEEYEETRTGKKKEVEKTLSDFERLIQQINNLLDSSIISASEIRHTAELVVDSISDTISILQKEKGAAEKFFPTLQSNIDFQSATRKEIVEAVGIDNLIHRAKEQFDPEMNDYEDYDTIDQADLLIDNWDAIVTLASDIFAMNEGFGIVRDYGKAKFTTTEKPQIDYDNFNDYSNDPDAMAEAEKDEQEHWQVEQRTIDVLNSMSQLVRLGIHECYQIDKNGEKVISKWGIAERVNPRLAVNSILRWTQGSLTLEDMVNKLSNKSAGNPWLNQLIERLSDQTGKEADFQSQFFGVFQKHFQPYSIVLLEDGKYHSIPVNSHPALSEAMQSITSKFKIGEHALFTKKSVNTKLLGSERTTGPKEEFNLHKALTDLLNIQNKINHGEELREELATEAANNIMGVCRIMGYPVTEDMVSNALNNETLKSMTTSLNFIVKKLDSARDEHNRTVGTKQEKQYNPFKFGEDNSIDGELRKFLTPIVDQLEDTAVSAFYDSGKMYQSYITPSFMTKLMNKFRLEGKEFEDFIMSEYGSSEWFKASKNQWKVDQGWRNEWLKRLATDETARKVFDHKVELNFNKHNYMKNMSDAEYTLSLITEYFAEKAEEKQSMVPAWFRVPMLSNKPSSEFVKFLSYRGSKYKDEIVYGLHQMFNQELSRIQTVLMRNYSKNSPEFIKNFDTNGRKFNFLPVFNTFLDEKNNSELGKLLREKLSGKVLSSSEESRLSALVDETIYQEMESRVTKILDEWENSGILDAAENIEGIGKSKEQVRASVENFLWNDAFAAKNILQLTITDIAFYKDAEDLQKRLAQIHAPGIRANVAATDYKGNKVSDGYYRTIVLKDFDGFKSNIIANISEVFDRKIAAAPENQKAQLIALKDSLVRAPKTNGENDKGGKYWNINVTDAQGYSSPSSYRKKAFMFGRWSQSAEDIYQKLLSNEYSYSDLETAFQPLKPFVYSHLQKEVGVENSPIQKIAVPFQAKNAEYLLIMADAILKGEELSRPNLLRAVYRIMEDSAYDGRTYDENGNILNSGTYNGRGIDTVQFESAIKSGLQGTIDIGQFAELPGGENAAYEFMKEALYTKDAQGNLTNIYNTETHVHEAPFEDYCLQQEVPEHFKNHSQAHGSQIRMIIPSDLDTFNTQNEENRYEWIEPDGTKKSVTASEFKNEYENTIADNIRESIDSLAAELHIYSTDKKERNIALSKILQREILSSPRYGIDLIQACSIDKETGDFRIPKGDPIQSKRIEQLINSIIKNRVNKQKIAGGPIVQVSNFGTSKQLHIRFNARGGGLLLMENEFTPTDQYKTYDEYKKAEQAGIAYFEVYVPIWNNELFDKFANEDGTIDTEAIEAIDPELLKMVSYRIPTEDKYSCAPMKVVGFMPREAGDAIMLPYELTEIDDSDFDVDKRYVMRKDIRIVENRNAIEKILIQKVSDSYAKAHDGKVDKKFIKDQVKMYMDNPDRMKDADKLMEAIHKQKQLIMKQYKDKVYKTIKPKSGKLYRDNKIVDMTWAVLTNEMTADKILNPGGFDNFKEIGYKAAAYKLHNGTISWEELDKMSIDELSDLCYIEKDLTWADTQIQFYKQNSAAASLIGVFAVNKVAHATLEGDDILIDVQEICGEKPFVIGSTKFGGFRDSSGRALMSEDEYKEWTKTIKGFKSKDMTYDEYVMLNRDPLQTNRMIVDAMYDTEGNFIGKTLGSGVSASADAAKTPVLNLLNINMTTVGTFTSLIRLGMPHEEACMFIGQDVIARAIDEFNRQNLTGYESLNSIIEKEIKRIQERHGLEENSKINTEPITREELIEGLTSKEHEVIDYKVLIAFQKAKALADSIRNLSYPTRFNSIASAVGPLIIDNLIMEHKIEQFTEGANESGTHFYDMNGDVIDINSVFDMHPVLSEFSRTVGIAATMFSDMPAGSTGFRNMLNTLPDGMKDKIYNDKKLLDSLSNFYQSYLLIASHLINPADLRKRIDEFPKYFNENKFTEKYPDNAFIQAIKTGVAKRTGRPFLSINITGVDEAQKEIYRNAWTDLHKENPELSKMLFEYCFFRAGIGFSPKTFMALVPTYVKERLATKLRNGDKATYVETYRKFPEVNFELIVDQWVRNNWDNNKLVPKKGSTEKDKDGKEKEGTKKSHYIVDINNGKLIARTPEDIAELTNEKYIKTRQNNQTYLWKQIYADDHAVDYTLVTPLGNNGEYIEMSLSDIRKALNETKDTVEDLRESELKETSPAEADAETPNRKQLIGNNEQAKNIGELADLIMKQNPKLNRTDALNKVENIKKDPSPYLGFLVNVFKQKGLNLSQEEALKEFEKYC